MSLGLIKGVVDEVDQCVNITWVQPRVLNSKQLSLLSEQIGGWADRVKNALITIEDQTPHLFV
jgi:26S proteasome regulatory subunit N9